MTPENDFAMLDYGEFKGIFRYPEKPDLAGKPYREFYSVKYETGPDFEGLENGYWVVRHPDPGSLPAPVPPAISPRQARLALLNIGKLSEVDAAVANSTEANKITWEYAVQILRDDPLVSFFGSELGFTSDQIDDLFRAAGSL
jgi:hypothetical protein